MRAEVEEPALISAGVEDLSGFNSVTCRGCGLGMT